MTQGGKKKKRAVNRSIMLAKKIIIKDGGTVRPGAARSAGRLRVGGGGAAGRAGVAAMRAGGRGRCGRARAGAEGAAAGGVRAGRAPCPGFGFFCAAGGCSPHGFVPAWLPCGSCPRDTCKGVALVRVLLGNAPSQRGPVFRSQERVSSPESGRGSGRSLTVVPGRAVRVQTEPDCNII